MSGPKTLFDKIWESHVVAENDDGTTLLYVDKHLIHEVTSWTGFERMAEDGRPVRRPDATLGVPDHSIPTRGRAAGVEGIGDPLGRSQVEALIANCERFGVPLIPLTDVRQGIVHIIGPEQGLTLPGATLVCGDSHTATHGAFGCLAFGIGSSEVEHVLATQTLNQKRPRNMRITVAGDLPRGHHRQGHDPRHHRRDRHRGRHWPRGRVRRPRDPRALHGRADDGLQHDHRRRRARRAYGAGRDHLRLSQRPAHGALGRCMGPGHGPLADPRLRRRRGLRQGSHDRCAGHRAADHLGHEPGGRDPGDGADAGPRRGNRRDAPRGDRPGPRLHGARARHAHRGRGRGPRLHRLLHQRPDRGSPRRRRRRQGTQGAGERGRHGGAGLRPREAPGRGRRARPHLPRSRLRMARSRAAPCASP